MSITSCAHLRPDVRRKEALSGNESPPANTGDSADYMERKKERVFRKSFIILIVLIGLGHLAHYITLQSKNWLRNEIIEIINEKETDTETQLRDLYAIIDRLEESVDELELEVMKQSNKNDDELELPADSATESSDGRVLKHSEVLPESWLDRFFPDPNLVHPSADEILTPSFDEPANCLALKGTAGFVVIKLNNAIIPEAVTLEHLVKGDVADEYRSSAPKDCRVSGWLQDEDQSSQVATEEVFDLAEFTYDIDKGSAQTFKVRESIDSRVIDTVRLDVKSNHGKSSYTCIYRFRVHGHEPDSEPTTDAQVWEY